MRSAIFDTEVEAMGFAPIEQSVCDTAGMAGKVRIVPVLLKSGAYPGKWAVTLYIEPAPELLEGKFVVDTVELPPEE